MFSKLRRIRERMNVRLPAGQWAELQRDTETTVPHGSSCIHELSLHQYFNRYSRRIRRVQRWNAPWTCRAQHCTCNRGTHYDQGNAIRI